MTEQEVAAIDEVIARAQQSNGMAAGHDVAMIHAPALLAEVRRLRALVESAYIEAAFDATRCWGDTPRERDELIAGHEFEWQHSDARKALDV